MSLLRITIFILFFIVPVEGVTTGDIDKLISDLDNRDRKVRLSAVEELGRIKDGKSVDLLMEVAGRKLEEWKVRVKAIQFLGENGDPKAAPLLISIFNDPFLNHTCPAIKSYTARPLGNFKGDSRVVDTLINGLDIDNLIVREAVIQALGEIGDPRAVSFLISILEDKSFAAKLSAIKALGKIGDPLAIPHLKQVAEYDSDQNIKDAALTALRDFETKEE